MKRKSVRSLALILLVVVFSIPICAQAVRKPVLWGDLSPGSYGVGFTVKTFSDESRRENDKSSGGRRIEIMIWYPALTNFQSSKLAFREYVSLSSVFRKGYTKSEINKWLATSITGDPSGIESEELGEILSSEMLSAEDASPINKRFPLVLWTMRHETMIAQSVLCEYLASYGYVVAVARFRGEPMPYPWAIKTPAQKLVVLQTHLKDLNFALKVLSKEENIDSTKVTMMNWSYAAELSSLMQTQNSNVGLVIGLSSNPLSDSGVYQGADAVSNLNPKNLQVPYVIMTEQIDANGKERIAPEILRKLPSESHFVSFSKLAHGNFNVLEGMIPGVFKIEKVQSWSKGGKTAKIGYEAISRYSLYFLDKYMKPNDKSKRQKLRKGLPKQFVKVTRFPAKR